MSDRDVMSSLMEQIMLNTGETESGVSKSDQLLFMILWAQVAQAMSWWYGKPSYKIMYGKV